MADPSALLPLAGALRQLVRWLKDGQTKGVVVGGVASSLLGRPRMTRDVDVLVLIEDAERAAFVARARPHDI